MQRLAVLALVIVGLVCTAGGDVHAQVPAAQPAAKVEQVYFEVVVSKAGTVVGKPHLLAALGKDGQISFHGMPDPYGAGPLGLNFRTQAAKGARVNVQLQALVNDEEVAARSLEITKDKGAEVSFDAGGYAWRVTVDYFTPAFVAKKRTEKR